PNELGRIAGIGAFIWIYKLRTDKAHRWLKLLLILALIVVLLLSKSRLSIGLFIALVSLFFLCTARTWTSLITRLLLGSATLVIGVWAILNIPILYDAFGFRFDTLLKANVAVDASTSTRVDMAA